MLHCLGFESRSERIKLASGEAYKLANSAPAVLPNQIVQGPWRDDQFDNKNSLKLLMYIKLLGVTGVLDINYSNLTFMYVIAAFSTNTDQINN